MKKVFSSIMSLLVLSGAAWGQEVRFDVSSSIDWLRGQLNATVSFNLAQAGLRLPSGRLMGEEILNQAYLWQLRPQLLSIRVDSDSSIRNLVEKGELSLEDLDTLSLEAKKTPPSLSADLVSMIGRYAVPLEKISAILIRHRRAAEPERPLLPVQTSDYTGIIIIADGELPIRGRSSRALVEPCLFPKIWDTNMAMVYERQMLEPERETPMVYYTVTESVFRPTPSGLEGELAALLGPKPLRIIARQVFGINPTDPVIDRDDALRILSTENNRLLLREGRLALVLNERVLKE